MTTKFVVIDTSFFDKRDTCNIKHYWCFPYSKMVIFAIKLYIKNKIVYNREKNFLVRYRHNLKLRKDIKIHEVEKTGIFLHKWDVCFVFLPNIMTGYKMKTIPLNKPGMSIKHYTKLSPKGLCIWHWLASCNQKFRLIETYQKKIGLKICFTFMCWYQIYGIFYHVLNLLCPNLYI